QLKPGYNLQIGVCSELIVSSMICSNPTDIKTLIPFLDKMKNEGINLKDIVADAGYESLENYVYLKNNNLVSYIKPQTYEKSKTRKFQKDLNRPENLIYDEMNNVLKRSDGFELEYVRDRYRKGNMYRIFHNSKTGKNVWYNYEFRKFSKESKENITTEKGIRLRMNRSIQVEGAFGVIKEDMKLRKLKISGLSGVKRELILICMGYNFKIHMYKKKHNKIGNILHDLKTA
ncbi:transposase, partial [Oceanivirga salmonicida]|uniref:transposase n=1 Tax=Oceanivirga salmonicida TaxID=1769291 RepID=UPI0012E1C20B